MADKFNWCYLGDHDNCVDTYERFFFEVARGGKWKRTDTGVIVECDCVCHGRAVEEKPKRRARRRVDTAKVKDDLL